jgi:hypothetical protein
VLPVPEAVGQLLDGLDLGVEPLTHRVGETRSKVMPRSMVDFGVRIVWSGAPHGE